MSEIDGKNNEGFDTDQQYIAGVYARSLIDATEKSGSTEDVLLQLDSFVVDVLSKIPVMSAMFGSPRVSREDKDKLIDSALSGKADRSLVNFLKVLNAHDRLDCLNAVNTNAKALFNEKNGRVEAFVTVAESMSDELKSSVGSKLKQMLGKEVILSVKVDPEIIGGMIVKVGDTVYDSSVANQLAQVRSKAMDGMLQKVRGSIESFVTESA